MVRILKRSLLFIVLLIIPLFPKAEQLSSTAEFSLITVSPGEDLYSCFGHSALLIQDTINQIFKMYNYGTFDFEDPNFYWNFTRGKLKYKLNVENPGELLFIAKMENRFVTQQILNLSINQTQRLYDFLEKNYLPENRFYKYDFFYDNCSTRIRDALKYACGDELNFNLNEGEAPLTFRQSIDAYLTDKRYQDLGMDLGLGMPADDLVSPAQKMFLPNNLKDIFNQTTVKIDGSLKKLVANESIILPNQPLEKNITFLAEPWFAFTILLVALSFLTFKHYQRGVDGKLVDIFLFGILGLFGVVLVFLWGFTDHGVTANNMNLLWANPLYLVFIYLLLKKKSIKRISSFFLLNFFIILYLLLFWNYLPQGLNYNCIPLLILIGIRSMYIYYRIDKNFVRW